MKKTALFALLAVLILPSFSFRPIKKYRITGTLFDKKCTLEFFGEPRIDYSGITGAFFQRAAGYETVLKSTGPGSALVKLNHTKEITEPHPLLVETLKDAKYFAQVTGGAYDPALYNIISLWESTSGKSPPADDAIREQLLFTGYSYLFVEPGRVYVKNNISITLSDIARGKVLGLLGADLKKEGIHDFLISSAGVYEASGSYTARGGSWRITIPSDRLNEKKKIFFDAVNCSVAFTTQEDDADGAVRYIIDPETGYRAHRDKKDSARTELVGVIAVSQIAGSSGTAGAQALAYGFYVLGVARGLELAGWLRDVEVIYLYREDGKLLWAVSKNIETAQDARSIIFSLKAAGKK